MDAANKIEAIRLLRDRTGMGLADAKEAVEAGHLPDKAHAPAPRALQQLPAAATALLREGNKIEAIKLIRQAGGLGLKEAKELADAAEREFAALSGAGSEALGPGQVPRTRFTPVLVASIAVAAAAAAWFALGRL